MSARFNGNTMELRHFHDFYFLEALQAAITIAKCSKPEWQFRHSVERLENDVRDAFETLSHEMAFRIYVYLWASALGESRHTHGLSYYVDELHGGMRKDVYKKAFDYFPSDKNVEIIKKVFAQKGWSSAYGGRAWLSIVEGMEMYGKVSDATFIDHAVDLEHNGGCVFNKEAKFGLDCYKSYSDSDYGTSELREFCNFKFSQNILKDTPNSYRLSKKIAVSFKVYNLFTRFINVIAETIDEKVDYTIAKRNLEPKLEWLSGYSVEWDYKELTECGTFDDGTKKAKIAKKSTKKSTKKSDKIVAKVKSGIKHSHGLSVHPRMLKYVGKVMTFRKMDYRYDRVACYKSSEAKYGWGDMWCWLETWLDTRYLDTIRQTFPEIQTGQRVVATVLEDDNFSNTSGGFEIVGKKFTFKKNSDGVFTSDEIKTDSGYKWQFADSWLGVDKEAKKTVKAKVKLCGLGSMYNGNVYEFYREGQYWISDSIMGGGGDKGHWLFFSTSLDFCYRISERRENRRPYAICNECDRELRENETYCSDVDGENYCMSCFDDKFGACDSCGGENYTENLTYIDKINKQLCESCYDELITKCDRCGREIQKDDAIYAEHHHKYYWLCERCTEKVMAQCSNCGEWYEDYFVTDDGGDTYCEECAKLQYCRKCTEYYTDLEWHVEHEHEPRRTEYTPVELPIDGDGVFSEYIATWEIWYNTEVK